MYSITTGVNESEVREDRVAKRTTDMVSPASDEPGPREPRDDRTPLGDLNFS